MSLFFIKRKLWRATFLAGWPHPRGWTDTFPIVWVALGLAGTLASQRAVGAVLVRPAANVTLVPSLSRWAEAFPSGRVAGSSSTVALALAPLTKAPTGTAFLTVDTMVPRGTNALSHHGIAARSVFTGTCMKAAQPIKPGGAPVLTGAPVEPRGAEAAAREPVAGAVVLA